MVNKTLLKSFLLVLTLSSAHLLSAMQLDQSILDQSGLDLSASKDDQTPSRRRAGTRARSNTLRSPSSVVTPKTHFHLQGYYYNRREEQERLASLLEIIRAEEVRLREAINADEETDASLLLSAILTELTIQHVLDTRERQNEAGIIAKAFVADTFAKILKRHQPTPTSDTE